MTHRLTTLFVLASLSLGQAGARAQDKPGALPGTGVPENPVSPNDADLLRGPASDLARPGAAAYDEGMMGSATLVEHDSTGKLKRLDISIEEAALEIVSRGLDAQTRAKTEEIVAERAIVWDHVLYDNTALVLEVQGVIAAEGPSSEKGRDALRRLAAVAPSKETTDAWRAKLVGALPRGEGEKMTGLISEYEAALTQELRDEAAAPGATKTLQQLVVGERFKEIGREIRRAHERRSQFDQARLEELLGGLNLTPEQDAKARNAIVSYAQKKILKTEQASDRLDLYRALSETLTPEQMRQFLETVGGRPRPRK